MPNYEIGNMFKQYNKPNNVLLVTTNGVIALSGLVMGKGVALQAKDLEPALPRVLAKHALEVTNTSKGYLGILRYGVLFEPDWSIGAFQTKYHWAQQSPIELIQYSSEKLELIAKNNKKLHFHLNFPGIGLGGLYPAIVKPLLENLPNNVTIWSM